MKKTSEKTTTVKLGPKRKYEDWMAQEIVKVAERCVALGIKSKDTFYRWLKEYPEFAEAYEASKVASQAFYENEMLKGMLGEIKGFNHQTAAMIMQNKFGDDYKKSGNDSETSNASIKKLSAKELDELIIEKYKKLTDER